MKLRPERKQIYLKLRILPCLKICISETANSVFKSAHRLSLDFGNNAVVVGSKYMGNSWREKNRECTYLERGEAGSAFYQQPGFA